MKSTSKASTPFAIGSGVEEAGHYSSKYQLNRMSSNDLIVMNLSKDIGYYA